MARPAWEPAVQYTVGEKTRGGVPVEVPAGGAEQEAVFRCPLERA